jgi:hypothetical protein
MKVQSATLFEEKYRAFLLIKKEWVNLIEKFCKYNSTNVFGQVIRPIAICDEPEILERARQVLREWEKFATFADECRANGVAASLRNQYWPIPFIVAGSRAVTVNEGTAQSVSPLTREGIIQVIEKKLKTLKRETKINNYRLGDLPLTEGLTFEHTTREGVMRALEKNINALKNPENKTIELVDLSISQDATASLSRKELLDLLESNLMLLKSAVESTPIEIINLEFDLERFKAYPENTKFRRRLAGYTDTRITSLGLDNIDKVYRVGAMGALIDSRSFTKPVTYYNNKREVNSFYDYCTPIPCCLYDTGTVYLMEEVERVKTQMAGRANPNKVRSRKKDRTISQVYSSHSAGAI